MRLYAFPGVRFHRFTERRVLPRVHFAAVPGFLEFARAQETLDDLHERGERAVRLPEMETDDVVFASIQERRPPFTTRQDRHALGLVDRIVAGREMEPSAVRI